MQEFLAERHASGLSAGTVKHIRATLRSALSHAERWGLVHRNVAKLVVVPTGERYKALVLTPEQAREFLKYAAVSKKGALLVSAITLGLRRGELLGLRWSDVDLDESALAGANKGRGLKLSRPKSERTKRELRLPSVTVDALKEHRHLRAIARQWAGSSWRETGFVFTTGIEMPLVPESVTPELNAVFAAGKLPRIRFHDLRHSCATLLLSLGEHPKLVQETLGHSTFQLTMDTYSHVIPALRNEVAERMDSVFVSTPTKTPTKHSAGRVQ